MVDHPCYKKETKAAERIRTKGRKEIIIRISEEWNALSDEGWLDKAGYDGGPSLLQEEENQRTHSRMWARNVKRRKELTIRKKDVS